MLTRSRTEITDAAARLGAASGNAPMDAGMVVGVTTQGAFTNLKGGLPLIIDGQIAGAIGVGSGSPDEDIEVAEAAIAALMDAIA